MGAFKDEEHPHNYDLRGCVDRVLQDRVHSKLRIFHEMNFDVFAQAFLVQVFFNACSIKFAEVDKHPKNCFYVYCLYCCIGNDQLDDVSPRM